MRLFSIRMRAEFQKKHISGAERIVGESELEKAINSLLKRPRVYDFINITIEEVKEYEVVECKIPISSFSFSSVGEARTFAIEQLAKCGVEREIAGKAVEFLSKGANPEGGNMRGAILMDIETGERLEPDKKRGIRTIKFDWEDRSRVAEKLLKKGYTLRTVDALALACKNLYCGVIAELCWSDDPNYLTGYVASEKVGYVRITPLKEKGDPLGGRVYFIRRENLNRVIKCLEEKVILIKEAF